MISTSRQLAIPSYQDITFNSFTHQAIPTLHMIVLLSYSVISLFFTHIRQFYCHIGLYQHHIWSYFCYSHWFPYILHTSIGSNVTLSSTNITYDCIFVTFGDSLMFYSHWMVPSTHWPNMAIFFSHSVVPFSFFLIFFF